MISATSKERVHKMDDEKKNNILIVDDEPGIIESLSILFSSDGYNVFESDNVDGAQNIMHRHDIDAVITDVKMPEKDGTALFAYIIENYPDIPVVFITAYGTVESAVTMLTSGAFYYFDKPLDIEKLRSTIRRAIIKRLQTKKLYCDEKRPLQHCDNLLVGNSEELHEILDTTNLIKDSSSSVVISGETGTGKELIARTLHYSGNRRDKPFIAVNCASIPKELMESELFGYEKGAFTGATTSRRGKFEEVSGGTFFLDEIGELDLSLQSKLLRVLEEREIERLGSNKMIKVDFRLVSSTNRNLHEEVNSGNFREDLLYRLNVIEIKVPALRERRSDISVIASEFLREFSGRENKTLTFSESVMRIFNDYDWPGNVRQLKNVVERAVVLAKKSTITEKELPRELLSALRHKQPMCPFMTLRELENRAVIDTLNECSGNKSKAARILGISRKAFYKRLREGNVSV
jgi:DNA-binding NtrC family response regulator